MNLVKFALKEDIGKGDITTNSVVPKNKKCIGIIKAREHGIISGLKVAKEVFTTLDKDLKVTFLVKEGSWVGSGQAVLKVSGRARSILTAERTALNFLCRLSGISTYTRMYVNEVIGKTKILDTRKTTPGMRLLEKHATLVGGAINHRFDLYDTIMIKDNHIQVVGSIEEAIKLARQKKKKIIVEAQNLAQVREALGADRIMLDNMSFKTLKKALQIINGQTETEISGGVNLHNVRKLASLGPDYISVGAITHSFKSLNLSMDIQEHL